MDGLGEHLLADSRLAQDQHVDAAPGHILDQRGRRTDRWVVDRHAVDRRSLGRGMSRGRHDQEREPADREALAGRDRDRTSAAKRLTADPGSVARVEILDRDRRPEAESNVLSREHRIVDHDIARRTTADHDDLLLEQAGPHPAPTRDQQGIALARSQIEVLPGRLRGHLPGAWRRSRSRGEVQQHELAHWNT